MDLKDTIVALATSGVGAIALIRVSGYDAIDIVESVFKARSGKSILDQPSHTLHLGFVYDDKNTVVDEILVSLFKGNRSYTGEPTVEISCHGSVYIQKEIIAILLSKGCRLAKEGEFTLRAFLNGKMDLSQAEAVADLIASNSKASHQVALQQMRGGFKTEIADLRQELLDFASLIELELDFSGEDVVFANRSDLVVLLDKMQLVLKRLIDSFSVGNVIKNGIPVAIIGEPNVGKSTLLNALLNEDRAIVSDIAGTTRDVIEDEIVLQGLTFRFIDTAGIRQTDNEIERIGIQKTFETINQARLIMYLIDATTLSDGLKILEAKQELNKITEKHTDKPVLLVINKIDLLSETYLIGIREAFGEYQSIYIAAKNKTGISQLEKALLSLVDTQNLHSENTIVTNSRHYQALEKALIEIQKVSQGLEEELPTDLLAIDIRQSLCHLGEITGEITNDDVLGNIFSNFCIGK